MPLRPRSLPFAPQRLFHATIIRRADSPNHYETLQIPPTATPSEVKKSFYTLSKTHHPDLNPNDPTASSRFVKISEAYAVLSIPFKRQAYDRETLQTQSPTTRSHPQGSFYSSSQAGGRPPSGLSRRRSQFRGPPPSFYRSGGWGNQSEKRQKAQEDTGEKDAKAGFKKTGEEEEDGIGVGEKSWAERIDINDVPHFDREGHFRTHENYDKRRRQKIREGFQQADETTGGFAMFLVLAGIISLAASIPVFMGGGSRTQKSRLEK